MQARAKQLAEGLRTPGEKLRDAFRELKELADGNFISQQTLQRGLRQTSDDFRKQLRAQLEASRKPIGVAEMGSQAALSAVTAAKNQDAIDREVNTRLLREILKANVANNSMFRQEVAKPPVNFVMGAF
jgi:hypothetical protein